MNIEIAMRHDLIKRFPVKIDSFKTLSLFIVDFVLRDDLIFLIIDVRISESALKNCYPFDIIRPIDYDCFSLVRLTPCIRIMSPHFNVFCYSPGIDNILIKYK